MCRKCDKASKIIAMATLAEVGESGSLLTAWGPPGWCAYRISNESQRKTVNWWFGRVYETVELGRGSMVPIFVEVGDAGPQLMGSLPGYTTIGGRPIFSVSAYRRKGWSGIRYHPDTRKIVVGMSWVPCKDAVWRRVRGEKIRARCRVKMLLAKAKLRKAHDERREAGLVGGVAGFGVDSPGKGLGLG